MIIDPPSPFAPKKVWNDFLKSLDGLPADDPAVNMARAEAMQMLEIKERGAESHR